MQTHCITSSSQITAPQAAIQKHPHYGILGILIYFYLCKTFITAVYSGSLIIAASANRPAPFAPLQNMENKQEVILVILLLNTLMSLSSEFLSCHLQ